MVIYESKAFGGFGYMPNVLQSKVLTVRLPPELYAAAQEVARQRDLSHNSLVPESLIAAIQSSEEQARYNDYIFNSGILLSFFVMDFYISPSISDRALVRKGDIAAIF